MKITQFRNDGKVQTQRILGMEAAVAAIQTEIKSRPVSSMREKLQYALPGISYDYVQKLPLLAFGGVFKRSGSEQELTTYNGLITLEINRLANQKEARQCCGRVSALPQTFLTFVGSSGKSVKIVVPFVRTDGTLPQQPEQVEMFHVQAYREAVKWYQPQLKREIELRKPALDSMVRLSFDPELYYNPEATAIRIGQPLRMPEQLTFTEALQEISDPLQRLLPGYERYNVISTLFETCLWKAIDEMDKGVEVNDFCPFFTALAENCFRSGIPEEEAVRFTLVRRELKKYELLARAVFRNAYTLGKKFAGKPCITAGMTLAARVEEFMQRRYQLRRNTIKGAVEYRELQSFCFDFRSLTKQAINSMTWNALSEGINAWDADIRRYVESDRVHAYHPIEEYLFALPRWDGVDRIRELAGRVPCSNSRWKELFYIWFLSMVAHWQQKDRKHANSTLPLLVGDQGCNKSTFCLSILPPELREYYTDSVDFSRRRDVELSLNRFALINMDEFDSIHPSYQSFMKHILQKTSVQTRRPYGTVTEQLRRHATFIATSNDFDLLTDPTGSRRFICVEVEGVIDVDRPIDYKQVYAQAVEAVQNGERFWFTHEEEAYITNSNRKFQFASPEEEVVDLYFRSPANQETYKEFTCAEILEKIRKRRVGFTYTRSTAMRLGRSLKTRFESRRTTRGWVYRVVET